MIRGRVPQGHGWQIVATADNWQVFARSYSDTEWRNVRVVSTVPREHKANYSLAWNGQRWADGNCYKALVEHNPALLRWLDGVMLCA